GDNKNIRQINLSLHSYNGNIKSLDSYMKCIFENVDKLVLNNTIIKYRMWVDGKYRNKIIKLLEDKYNVKIDDKKKAKLSDNVYYEVEQEFIWPNLDNSYESSIGSCRGTRDHIGILVDGEVVPCCLDSNGIINLGNIYKQDLNDIINSELFKEIKEGFLNNKKVNELCKKCNFYDLRR
ncbi:MAG TPA: radical SAM protein, partial [Firmicutes bacterium]|nr:radical SAM protein [Bacillota bacterium]